MTALLSILRNASLIPMRHQSGLLSNGMRRQVVRGLRYRQFSNAIFFAGRLLRHVLPMHSQHYFSIHAERLSRSLSAEGMLPYHIISDMQKTRLGSENLFSGAAECLPSERGVFLP